MENIKIKLEIDLKVSEEIKEKIMNNPDELVTFIVSNAFKNNERTLVSESVEEINKD